MEDRFENYFSRLNSTFPRGNQKRTVDPRTIDRSFTLYDIIESAVAADQQSGMNSPRLRADALTFLYTNFNQMVLQPQVQTGNKENIGVAIYNDVRLIMQEARKLAEKSTDREISGHQILIATAHVWNRLNTMSKDSW